MAIIPYGSSSPKFIEHDFCDAESTKGTGQLRKYILEQDCFFTSQMILNQHRTSRSSHPSQRS